MRNASTTAILVGALSVAPVIGSAATPGEGPRQSTANASTATASHATTGVVKSVNATTLVITRSGKKSGEMAFVLNSSTHRDDTVGIGSQVSVRYREDGKSHVATAITAQHPKQQAARTAPSGR